MSRPLNPTEDIINGIINKFRSDLERGKLDINATNFKAEFNLPKGEERATISITDETWVKMTGLIKECSDEIAWHCTVEKDKNIYKITDVIVFPQTVTGATVTSDETEYSEWINALDDNTFNKMRCHMHSHVNMGVNPSNVDKTYQNQVIQNEEKFYIFMIWNKAGKNWATIVDVIDNIIYFDEDIELEVPNDNTNWAKEQIEKYVQKYKYTQKPSKPCAKTEAAKKNSPKKYTYNNYIKEQIEKLDKPSEDDFDDDDIMQYELQLDEYWKQFY